MQDGDLDLWTQSRMVVVLEGVLADITSHTTGRIRKHTTRSYHWLPVPMKRLTYLKNHWPDVSVEVITFLDQDAADEAAVFFDAVHVPVSSVSYRPLDRWVQEITWQPEIRTIYDSDVERLMQYGQRGYAVLKGEDFHT